jgi:ribonuclease J
MYIVEINDDIYILDVGFRYPENDMLGIDVVIPEFTYLEENAHKIAGVFLTHGHPDAMGALPYFLSKFDVPVFGTELTIELAKFLVSENEESAGFDDFHVINANSNIEFENVNISFFATTHSIPDGLGIVIETEQGSIVYTGDFKFDMGATSGYETDFARLVEIGNKGVLALLSDSSNAEVREQLASEIEAGEVVADTIANWEGRIIVACVASNLQRVEQIINGAYKAGRKIVLSSTDLEKIVRTAIRLNKLNIPADINFVSPKNIRKIPDNELLVLETGRMGEPLKTLQRMANQTNRLLSIKEGDLVYITTSPNSSMETVVFKTEDMVYRAGGVTKHVNDDVRVSGHATANDLKLLIKLLKPQNLIPIGGEYRELIAHAKLGRESGLAKNHIVTATNGDVIETDVKEGVSLAGSVPAASLMIDGIGSSDIGNVVLNDRRMLSEDGVFVAIATINRREKKIVASPVINSRGFVYAKASRELLNESSVLVKETIEKYLTKDDFEWGKIKSDVRDALGKYLFNETKRRPVILPIIMESKNIK